MREAVCVQIIKIAAFNSGVVIGYVLGYCFSSSRCLVEADDNLCIPRSLSLLREWMMVIFIVFIGHNRRLAK